MAPFPQLSGEGNVGVIKQKALWKVRNYPFFWAAVNISTNTQKIVTLVQLDICMHLTAAKVSTEMDGSISFIEKRLVVLRLS